MKTLIVGLMLSTAGCSATKLYDIGDADNGGIPFFPLVPANRETRQYEQSWLRLDVTVSQLVPVSTDKETAWKDAAFTSTFFAADPATFDDAAKYITVKMSGLRTPAEAQSRLLELLKTYRRTEPERWTQLTDIKAAPLIGVQREVVQIPSTSPRFVNMWTPYGGSANADIHLDARGTLTEALAQRQDQLPQTVATAVGTIGAAAVTAIGTVAAAGLKTNPVESPQKGALGQTSQEPRLTGVTVTATRTGRIYTLGMTWPVGKGGPAAPNPCLALADIDTHAGDCLLTLTAVSETVPPAAAPKPEK